MSRQMQSLASRRGIVFLREIYTKMQACTTGWRITMDIEKLKAALREMLDIKVRVSRDEDGDIRVSATVLFGDEEVAYDVDWVSINR